MPQGFLNPHGYGSHDICCWSCCNVASGGRRSETLLDTVSWRAFTINAIQGSSEQSCFGEDCLKAGQQRRGVAKRLWIWSYGNSCLRDLEHSGRNIAFLAAALLWTTAGRHIGGIWSHLIFVHVKHRRTSAWAANPASATRKLVSLLEMLGPTYSTLDAPYGSSPRCPGPRFEDSAVSIPRR